MKNIITYILFLFVVLVVLGTTIDYAYAAWTGTGFEWPLRKYVFYAVFAIIFGFWRGRKMMDK